MSFHELVSSNCEGGNALGKLVKAAERPNVGQLGGHGEESYHEGNPDLRFFDQASDRPAEAEIEAYMQQFAAENGPPLFQTDEEANAFLQMGGGDLADGQMPSWMNNFWGSSFAPDSYEYQFSEVNPFLNHPAPFEEG